MSTNLAGKLAIVRIHNHKTFRAKKSITTKQKQQQKTKDQVPGLSGTSIVLLSEWQLSQIQTSFKTHIYI